MRGAFLSGGRIAGGRIGRLAALALAMTAGANAYYHFVHYTRFGSFSPIPEKFDLQSLVNKTVPFLISEQGATQLAPGDSPAGLTSQILLAAKSWNQVRGSEIRLAFGGFFAPGAAQNAPVIEVIFDDVPPGLVAYGGPTLRGEVVNTPGGSFMPILKSTIVLRRDLSARPSWSEALFLTVAHEFGHALGLQHTLTSGAMSTEVTRATTKAQPLTADDAAGLSLLYPAPGFLASTGSIRGRVTSEADSMNLASVVALASDGVAISALSNPDGSYRIDGLPPGTYYVYVHPLPPAAAGEAFPANITPASDLGGRPYPASGSFETVFYPGVKDPLQARVLPMVAGASVEGIDFQVRRRPNPAVYGVQTYSFPGQVAVKPAHVSASYARNFVVASGAGLTLNNATAPGLSVDVFGGSAAIPSDGLRPYAQDPRFLQIDFQLNPFAGEGPRHLLFRSDNDMHVLPSGFRVVGRVPPSVTSLSSSFDAAGNRVVQAGGAGLTAETQVLFDGVAGTPRSFDERTGLIVSPPPAPGGHRAAVVALNSDGQSSLFLQGGSPPFYEYEPSNAGGFVVNPTVLAPGVETMVEILGTNTNFAASHTSFGLGTPGIAIRRSWVVSPTRILANVIVSEQSAQTAASATLVSGLRVWTAPAALQVGPLGTRTVSVRGPVLDALRAVPDVAAGSAASVSLAGVAPESQLASFQIQVADRPAQALSYTAGVLTFVVPASLQPGPAVLRIAVSGEAVPPVVLSVDLPPPAVLGVQTAGVAIDGQRPARPGESIALRVRGLGDPGAVVTASRIGVTVGGASQLVVSATAADADQLVQVQLSTSVPPGLQPLVVTYDERISAAYVLPVR